MGHVPDSPARRDGAGKVGEFAPASLGAIPGRVHDVGVEADPAGHRDVVGLPADGRPPHVDAAVHPEDHVLSRAVGPARYSQIACKQVAGPGRDDTEGDARSDQRAGGLVDGTVAANNDDDITAVFDRPARDVA